MECEWDAVRNPQRVGRSTHVVDELMVGQETVDELSEEDDSDRNSNLHTVGSKGRDVMLLKALWFLGSIFCVRQSVSVLGQSCFILLSVVWFTQECVNEFKMDPPSFVWCLRSVSPTKVWCQGYSHKELQGLQQNDPVLSIVFQWLKAGKIPSICDVSGRSPGLRHYWVYWNSLELKDGLVYRRYYRQDGTGSYLQFIVPKALRDEVLRMMHNCALAGHLGYNNGFIGIMFTKM